MINALETLKHLRQSLNDEDDDTSVIHIMENHHKYLKEYINMLNDSGTAPEDKQALASLFLCIFQMHAHAEGDSFYPALREASSHEVRLLGIKGQDEHEIAFEIVDEIKSMDYKHYWSEDIDAKIRMLTGLIKSHIKEEESVVYPNAKRSLSEKQLVNLTNEYLKKCLMYLDMEMESGPSDVSRSDVITFFY